MSERVTACEIESLPQGCLRGHMEYGAEEWEDEEGGYHLDEWEYCECDEWAPGYPRMGTERFIVLGGGQ